MHALCGGCKCGSGVVVGVAVPAAELSGGVEFHYLAWPCAAINVVPCHATLCCAVTCLAHAVPMPVPRHAMPCACPCRAMPCCDIPSHPILSHAIPSYPMPCQSHAHLIPGFVYVRRPIADIFEFERAGPGAGRRGDALPSHRGAATSTLH